MPTLAGLRKTGRLLWRLKLPTLAAVLLLLIVGLAMLAPYVAPYDPLEADITARLKPPRWLACWRSWCRGQSAFHWAWRLAIAAGGPIW